GVAAVDGFRRTVADDVEMEVEVRRQERSRRVAVCFPEDREVIHSNRGPSHFRQSNDRPWHGRPGHSHLRRGAINGCQGNRGAERDELAIRHFCPGTNRTPVYRLAVTGDFLWASGLSGSTGAGGQEKNGDEESQAHGASVRRIGSSLPGWIKDRNKLQRARQSGKRLSGPSVAGRI